MGFKFENWFKILQTLAKMDSNPKLISNNCEEYRDYFEDGHTPRDTLDMEKFHNAKWDVQKECIAQ